MKIKACKINSKYVYYIILAINQSQSFLNICKKTKIKLHLPAGMWSFNKSRKMLIFAHGFTIHRFKIRERETVDGNADQKQVYQKQV